MAKIGDQVRFLSTTGGGKVVKIDGQIAHVEEDDGFVTPVMLKELVVVSAAGEESGHRDIFGGTGQNRQQIAREAESKMVVSHMPDEENEAAPAIETPQGEQLNIVLAFAAMQLKHLTTTNYEAYVVNDSNYYIYFTFLSREDSESGWHTRYAGLVEPNMQVFLEELTGEQVGHLGRIAFQYIAFKRDRSFRLKAPVAVETRMDTTKFFKLHCFRDNPYFDEPVIAIDIVKNDIPQRQLTIDSSSLEDAMRQKQRADRKPVQIKKPVKKAAGEPVVVDLHINELVDTTRGMSPADMLNYQIDTFRRTMDQYINHSGTKIVFIHGKGEGVLRQALLKELSHRYKGHDVQDASFREYGYGATQVTIRHH